MDNSSSPRGRPFAFWNWSFWSSPKYRKWITILQDHYLAGDDPYWRVNQNAGSIEAVRDALEAVRAAIGHDDNSAILREEVGERVGKVERHLDNLGSSTSFWFRFAWLVWALPIIGWTLWLAIILEDWGQLIAQEGVLSRTLSLGIAILRNKRGTASISFKYYEDRLVGDLPSLIFYTIASRPAYRHLHGDWRFTVFVGGITGFVLLLVSFWGALWFSACLLWKKWRRPAPVLTQSARERLRAARDQLSKSVEDLKVDVENADISDRMKDHFLMLRRDADRLLRTIGRFLPSADALVRHRYARLPKVPLSVITVILVGQALGASYRYPWFMAVTAGWGIWQIARMVFDNIRPYTSPDDMARVFSNIVAGTVTLLPLTLAMLFTIGAILEPFANKVLMSVVVILSVNLFSNLVGTLCTAFGRKIQVWAGRSEVETVRAE